MIKIDEKTKTENFKKGISPKFSYHLNGETYIFKGNYKDMRQDISEVLFSRILKKTGCKNFVEYHMAEYQGQNGCVSKSFFTPDVLDEIFLMNMEQMTYYFEKNHERTHFTGSVDAKFFDEFFEAHLQKPENMELGQYIMSIPSVCGEVEKFCKIYGYTCDMDKLKKRLSEAVVYDYFLCNSDRHWNNLTFLTKEKDGVRSIELSPLFDNGEAFGFSSGLSEMEIKRQGVVMQLGYSQNGQISDFKNNRYFEKGGIVASDIYELTKQDEKMKELVEKLVNLNISAVIDEMEKDEQCSIPPKIREKIIDNITERQSHYKYTVEQLQNRLNKSQLHNLTKSSELEHKNENIENDARKQDGSATLDEKRENLTKDNEHNFGN